MVITLKDLEDLQRNLLNSMEFFNVDPFPEYFTEPMADFKQYFTKNI